MHEFDRPFSEEERRQVLDAAFARVDSAAPRVEARVLRWRAGIIGVGLMLAAAFVLWFAIPRGAPGAVLPDYTATRLDGGHTQVRSAEPARTLAADDAIDWVFTPREPIRDRLDIAIVAVPQGGAARLERVTDRVEQSHDGAIRMSGELRRFIELAPGHWELAVVIAPAGNLPADAHAALSRASAAGWRTVTFEVDIVAPTP